MKEPSQNIIKKETPHMFMWFSDGKKIPKGSPILPQSKQFDYHKRLKEECGKMSKTSTPVYLVYMGRLLNDEQKKQIKSLSQHTHNLFIIDYDDVEKKLPNTMENQQIRKKVQEYTTAYQEKELLTFGKGGIADLVDFTRLVLIYNSDIVGDIAKKQHFASEHSILGDLTPGIIYRDFDVTLSNLCMRDLKSDCGYLTSLNFKQVVNGQYDKLIKKAGDNAVKKDKINGFFTKNLYNLAQYKKNVKLFYAEDSALSPEDKQRKKSINGDLRKIGCERDFKSLFINAVSVENSFIAVNNDKNEFAKKTIDECLLKSNPFGAVQNHFSGSGGKGRKEKLLLHTIETVEEDFDVGNDLTWKKPLSKIYTGENKKAEQSAGKALMSASFIVTIGVVVAALLTSVLLILAALAVPVILAAIGGSKYYEDKKLEPVETTTTPAPSKEQKPSNWRNRLQRQNQSVAHDVF
jgi:hypothetical protein